MAASAFSVRLPPCFQSHTHLNLLLLSPARSLATLYSRRRVPPLFAEPDAYFRSSYPTLARQPKSEPLQNPRPDRSLGTPTTKGKSSNEKQRHASPVVRHGTWEAIPFRSWPSYQVEESRSPVKREKVYVRPATAVVQRNASMASPKSANWRPSSSSHRPRSPYDVSYMRDHKLATTSLKALRRDLTELLTKVDTLESHEILSKTSAVKQAARSVAVDSQPTPLMGNVGDVITQDTSLDLSSSAPAAGDSTAKAGSTGGAGGGDDSKRLDLHEAELDMLLLKFGLRSEQPSFRPVLMHPPGYIYTPGDRRKLSLEHESEDAGKSAALAHAERWPPAPARVRGSLRHSSPSLGDSACQPRLDHTCRARRLGSMATDGTGLAGRQAPPRRTRPPRRRRRHVSRVLRRRLGTRARLGLMGACGRGKGRLEKLVAGGAAGAAGAADAAGQAAFDCRILANPTTSAQWGYFWSKV